MGGEGGRENTQKKVLVRESWLLFAAYMYCMHECVKKSVPESHTQQQRFRKNRKQRFEVVFVLLRTLITCDSSGRSSTVSSCSRCEVSRMSFSASQSWTSISLYSHSWASAMEPEE